MSLHEREGIDFSQKVIPRFVTPRIPRRKDRPERYRLTAGGNAESCSTHFALLDSLSHEVPSSFAARASTYYRSIPWSGILFGLVSLTGTNTQVDMERISNVWAPSS